MKSILSVLIGASLACCAVEAGAEEPIALQKIQVDIARQSLNDALNAWAEQTGFQLVCLAPEVAREVVAPKMKGAFTAMGALEQLLSGTPLVYEFTSERTVTVKARFTAASSITMGAVGGVVPRLQIAALNAAEEHTGQAAESSARSATDSRAIPNRETSADRSDVEELEEVVVTGTHIQGVDNRTVPRMTFTREDIDRKGHVTTQDFIRSLPQNFNGGDNGASEDGVINSVSGLSNVESASGINLRGLGTGSTLVLVNGHRVAPAAYGAVVDVSMIPLQAIERVDVMTDGASSIYGADAVGGVVNFTLRKDYDGAESSVIAGAPTGGGRRQYSVGQTFGASSERGSALLSFQYQDAAELEADKRSFTRSVPHPTDLYPSSTQYSGIFNGRRPLSSELTSFADVLYNHETTERQRTTFGSTDGSRVRANALSANAGLDWQPSSTWHIEVSGLYSEMDTVERKTFTPVQDGFTNGSPFIRNEFTLTEANVKGNGSVFSVPGGDVKAALGGSWRREDFTSRIVQESLDRPFKRDVTGTFAEIFVPLIGSANRARFVERLEVSAAVRHEHYSDFGDTTNPKFGVSWGITDSLSLRASYGTSFHAPTAFDEIGNATNLFVYTFPFASPAGGEETILLLAGSPRLEAELSRDLTIGSDFSPDFLPGFTLSLNYYQIDYKDRLVTPPFDTAALLQPDVYGSLIRQFSSDAEVAAYVDSLLSQGFIFDDIAGTGLGGILFGYSTALTNASRVRQTGFDVVADYRFVHGENIFRFGFNAAVIDRIKTGFCTTCSSTNLVDTYGQPLRMRLRGDAGWSRGQWQWNAAVNYAGSYADTTVTPKGHIADWITVDLNALFSPLWLAGTTFGLSVVNLFDRDPPRTGGGVVFSDLRYDSGNANPLGRVISLQARKTW